MKPSVWSSPLRCVCKGFRSNQRSLTTAHRPIDQTPRCAAIRPSLPRAQLQQTFRRSYADAVSPTTKRRGRGFFRWTWRLTYLSALAGVGYLTYTIYLLRSPNEQFNPDPSKKTLVILGRLLQCLFGSWMAVLTIIRYWLGLRVPSQKARYGKLQCYRHLAAQLLPLHASAPIMYNRHDRTSIHHGTRTKHPPPQESHR